MSNQPADLVTVRLLDVPVDLRLRSEQHGNELVREMTLLTMRPDMQADVPERLCKVANQLKDQYGPQVEASAAITHQAAAEGRSTIPELVYELPPSVTEFVRQLDLLLREVDEFCSAGEHLLTLATPPDVAAYREWTIREVERQVAGEEPVPWPVYRQRFTASQN